LIAQSRALEEPEEQNGARIRVDSIAAQDISMLPGDSASPRILILPTDASNPDYELTSGNQGVAQIRDGAIHGGMAGIAVLNVRALDGSGKLAQFQVCVAPKPTDLDSKTLHLELDGPGMAPLLDYEPSDAKYNGYSLSGGNRAVVAISPDGTMLIPVGKGGTFVKAKVRGYPKVTSTFWVTVGED
jgi:hypothetical protein